MVTVDTATRLSGIDPATECLDAIEAYPERSQNVKFGLGAPALFSGYAGRRNSSATDWNTWPSTSQITPSVELLPGAPAPGNSDDWSATSGTTGLDYISQLISDPLQPGDPKCFAIAAATPSNRLSPTTWDFPLNCVAPGNFDNADGTSIAYDLTGSTLWGATASFTGGASLYIFENCGFGAPGSNACPVTTPNAQPILVPFPAFGHPVVEVDPCNHLGILGFRSGTEIHLRFYTSSGVEVQDLITRTGSMAEVEDYAQASTCVGTGGFVPKCSPSGNILSAECDERGLGGCLRLVSKVHIATQHVAGQCFAYVAYDSSRVNPSTGETFLKANLDVVNVTTPGGAFEVAGFRAAHDADAYNTFSAVTAATDSVTPGGAYPVGWFWYRQISNQPCATVFEGAVSIDQFGTLSGISTVGISPTSFPSVLGSLPTMGDYVGTIKRGLPGIGVKQELGQVS